MLLRYFPKKNFLIKCRSLLTKNRKNKRNGKRCCVFKPYNKKNSLDYHFLTGKWHPPPGCFFSLVRFFFHIEKKKVNICICTPITSVFTHAELLPSVWSLCFGFRNFYIIPLRWQINLLKKKMVNLGVRTAFSKF